MVNWIFVAAFFAAVSAAPQSYIVAPGHFHYEFGGQNEYKFTTPAPAVKAVPVSTPAPVVTPIRYSVSTPAPIVTPVVKNIEYQVNPVTYRTPVTTRPITQQITVSEVPVQQYPVQYNTQQYVSQYPASQYNANSLGNQRYVSQSVGVSVPQVSKVTVPVSTVRAQPVNPTAAVVTVQQPQPTPQVYSTQVQSGQNYGGYAILRYVIDIQPQGSYNYAYETENGIKAEETGEVKNAGTQDEAEAVQGFYTYTGPDGVVYTVRYIADENGFRAEGDHLPKIPEAIQRALEYLRTLPPQPDEQKK